MLEMKLDFVGECVPVIYPNEKLKTIFMDMYHNIEKKHGTAGADKLKMYLLEADERSSLIVGMSASETDSIDLRKTYEKNNIEVKTIEDYRF